MALIISCKEPAVTLWVFPYKRGTICLMLFSGFFSLCLAFKSFIIMGLGFILSEVCMASCISMFIAFATFGCFQSCSFQDLSPSSALIDTQEEGVLVTNGQGEPSAPTTLPLIFCWLECPGLHCPCYHVTPLAPALGREVGCNHHLWAVMQVLTLQRLSLDLIPTGGGKGA